VLQGDGALERGVNTEALGRRSWPSASHRWAAPGPSLVAYPRKRLIATDVRSGLLARSDHLWQPARRITTTAPAQQHPAVRIVGELGAVAVPRPWPQSPCCPLVRQPDGIRFHECLTRRRRWGEILPWLRAPTAFAAARSVLSNAATSVSSAVRFQRNFVPTHSAMYR
jgi:hypothetical protein